MRSPPVPRGQPVRALAAVLLGWAMLRLWVQLDLPLRGPRDGAVVPAGPRGAGLTAPRRRFDAQTGDGASQSGWPSLPAPPQGPRPPPRAESRVVTLRLAPVVLPIGAATTWPARDAGASRGAPMVLAAEPGPASAMPMVPDRSTGEPAPRLISGDAWLLVRGGAGGLSGLAPSYGASQGGAILRRALSSGAMEQGFVYLRGSAALAQAQRDVALGLGRRPLDRVPAVLAGELRVVQTRGLATVRPAIGLITTVAPLRLPRQRRITVYAQAGWVGGRGATPYADGQMLIEQDFAAGQGTTLHVGFGLWGAGQTGAARLDAGPSLSLTLPAAARATLRLQADWRQRIVGHAAPGSGPALVLAASF